MIPLFPYEELHQALPISLFATHRDDLLRTVGLCQLSSARRPDLEEWLPDQVRLLSQWLDPLQTCEQASARGKFSIIQRLSRGDGFHVRQRCFQVRGTTAEIAFCGNATAASAAMLAHRSGEADVEFLTLGPDATARVRASVHPIDAGFQVAQKWLLPSNEQSAATVDADGYVHINLVNPYLVVPDLPPEKVAAVYQAFANRHGVQAKLAVVRESADGPYVEFFNCNGRHGSAPLTGLLTLGVVRCSVDWVRYALASTQIRTPTSKETIPNVELLSTNEVCVEFPDVSVELFDLKFVRGAM